MGKAKRKWKREYRAARKRGDEAAMAMLLDEADAFLYRKMVVSPEAKKKWFRFGTKRNLHFDQEDARRRRQIERGQLRADNGLQEKP